MDEQEQHRTELEPPRTEGKKRDVRRTIMVKVIGDRATAATKNNRQRSDKVGVHEMCDEK